MEGYINTLISAGADAMNNMFEVRFLNVPYSADVSAIDDALSASAITESLMVRTDGFTPPVPSQATYTTHYKTVSMDRPATKIVLDRTFTVTIRLDAYYNVYKVLERWHGKTAVAAHGFASNAIPADLATVEVRALDTPITELSDVAGTTVPEMASGDAQWKFDDVWIESITPPTYSTASTDPSTVQVKFRFGRYSDPQSNYIV